jgi:hypothetical protein
MKKSVLVLALFAGLFSLQISSVSAKLTSSYYAEEAEGWIANLHLNVELAEKENISNFSDAQTIWYEDHDHDGYSSGLTVIQKENPSSSDYVLGSNIIDTAVVDCDDNDSSVWFSDNFYHDVDGDGYDDGSGTYALCWDRVTPPSGYTLVSLGVDCDDNDSSVFFSDQFYTDADGDGYDDGYGTTALCWDGVTPPSAHTLVSLGIDCDDNDSSVWFSDNFYHDVDGDGYDDGSGIYALCWDRVTPPSGYTLVSLGVDCDDADNTVWLTDNFYRDVDGDGYDDGTGTYALHWDGVTPPSGTTLVSLGIDCNDSDNTVWLSDQFYTDADGDGYDDGTGKTTQCWDGVNVPPGYILTSNGADCNDNDQTVHESVNFYIDFDGDGYGSGSPVPVCTADATIAPPGYSLYDTDCDDNNFSVWVSGDFYIDFDGDGYDDGTGTYAICWDGVTPPSGHTLVTLGIDCNDNDSSVWLTDYFYIDSDGDGYDDGSGTHAMCWDGVTLPPGHILTSIGTDCNDSDALLSTTCGGIDDPPPPPPTDFIDSDNDGYPEGTDCDDTDPSVWQSQNLYIDQDGDGYDFGRRVVCYGNTVPGGYSLMTKGTDCNDNDSAITTNCVTAPSIISATYDVSTGTFIVTGTDLLALAGSSPNDVIVSKLTITGEGSATYTLVSGDVELDSPTQFTVVLNATDQTAVNALLDKNGTASSDATTYNLAVADGWLAANVGNADLTGNGITVIAIFSGVNRNGKITSGEDQVNRSGEIGGAHPVDANGRQKP